MKTPGGKEGTATRREWLGAAGGLTLSGVALAAIAPLRPADAAETVAYVDLLNNQTIAGTKTFTVEPIFPTPKVPVFQTQGGTLASPANTEIFRFQPRDPDKGPFGMQMWTANFGGVVDNVMGLGYNIGSGGYPSLSNEPIFRFCIEQHYFDGAKQTVEAYFEWVPKSGQFSDTRRPIFWQFDRDKNTSVVGSLAQFALCAEAIVFLRWSDNLQFASFGPGTLSLYPVPNIPTGLALYTPPGKGSAINMQHSGVNTFAISTLATSQAAIAMAGLDLVYFFQQRGMAINVQDNAAALTVRGFSTNAPVVQIKALPNQTADTLQIRDSTGKVGHRFDKNSYLVTRKTAAPADGDLTPSEAIVWWKDTPGAAGVQWKGKDASGGSLTFDFSRQAVLPDTSGATLVALESEVNALKARMRAMGLMA